MEQSVKFKSISASGKIFSGEASHVKAPGRCDLSVIPDVPCELPGIPGDLLASAVKYLMSDEAACSVRLGDGSEVFRVYENGKVLSDSDRVKRMLNNEY